MEKLPRRCGNCTACCLTHKVDEIEKPGGVWCKHCTIGKGCKIYTDRPGGCERFECQWLKGSFSDRERPDRSKVIVDFRTEGALGPTLQLFEVRSGSLNGRFAEEMTRGGLEHEYYVQHLLLSGKWTMFFPKGWTPSPGVIELFEEEGGEIRLFKDIAWKIRTSGPRTYTPPTQLSETCIPII